MPNQKKSPALLLIIVALATLLGLTVVSLFKPILNQRGMMLVSPYILLVLAAGVTALARRRWTIPALAVLIVTVSIGSLRSYSAMAVDPADYRAFATRLQPRIEPSDLVFLYRRYDMTPMLYYLDPDRYQLVGQGYDEACRHNPDARIWALVLYEDDFPPAVRSALRGYHSAETIEIPHAKAVLFTPVRQ